MEFKGYNFDLDFTTLFGVLYCFNHIPISLIQLWTLIIYFNRCLRFLLLVSLKLFCVKIIQIFEIETSSIKIKWVCLICRSTNDFTLWKCKSFPLGLLNYSIFALASIRKRYAILFEWFSCKSLSVSINFILPPLITRICANHMWD